MQKINKLIELLKWAMCCHTTLHDLFYAQVAMQCSVIQHYLLSLVVILNWNIQNWTAHNFASWTNYNERVDEIIQISAHEPWTNGFHTPNLSMKCEIEVISTSVN